LFSMYNRNKQAPTLIDTPTPKCFPNWMRRLNPFLKKEDTNAFFEAMIRVKLVHRPDRRKKLLRFVSSCLFSFTVISAILTNNILLSLTFLFFSFIIIFLSFRKRKETTSRQDIKGEMTDSFSFYSNASKGLLQDLWLCGLGGKEIVEGILLLGSRNTIFFILLLFFPFYIQCFLVSSIITSVYSVVTFLCVLGLIPGVILSVSLCYFYFIAMIQLDIDETNSYNIQKIFNNSGKEKVESLFRGKYTNTLLENLIPVTTNQTAVIVLGAIWIIAIYGIVSVGYIDTSIKLFFYLLFSLSYTPLAFYIWKKSRSVWVRSMRSTLRSIKVLSTHYPHYFRRVCFDDIEPNRQHTLPTEKKEPASLS
jgi:hypothetical protein